MTRRKAEISTALKIKDLGPVHEYLGIQIKRRRPDKTFLLGQGGLIDSVTNLMRPGKSEKLPMNPLNNMNENSPFLDVQNHELYRSVLGKLLYLAWITRPDIALVVNLLGRQVATPTEHHLHSMRKLAGYLTIPG